MRSAKKPQKLTTLKRLRDAANLSQRELGERLGVTEITVRSWESGARFPTIQRLREMAKILDCDPSELLT